MAAAALRPGGHRRPAQRRQEHAAQRAGGPEDQHHQQQGADHAPPHHRHPHRGRRAVRLRRHAGLPDKHMRGTALNRTLNRTVLSSLGDVDVVLFVVEAGRFGLPDAKVLALLPADKPVLLVANKLDALARRQDVLPWLKQHAGAPPVCRVRADVGHARGRRRAPARHRRALPARAALAVRGRRAHRPQRAFPGRRDDPREAVPPDRRRAALQLHRGDRQVRGRRRLLRAAGRGAAPHRRHHRGRARRAQGHGHRRGGERLKRIGSETRQELERLWDAKVFLELWVKVRSGWADDEAHLRSYGYEYAGAAAGAGGARRSCGRSRWAFVLHQYDWSESSLIVELFTREQGRVVVVAKGAKRPTPTSAPVLLPFQPVQVLLGRAPKRDEAGEVHNLRSAEWAGGGRAAAAAGAVQRLLPERAAAEAAGPAGSAPRAVRRLCRHAGGAAGAAAEPAAADEAAVLRAFELVLLRETGLLPELSMATLTAAAAGRPALHAACRGRPGGRPARPACPARLDGAGGRARAPAAAGRAAPRLPPVAAGAARAAARLLHYHLGTRRCARARSACRALPMPHAPWFEPLNPHPRRHPPLP
jgi:GTPase